MSRESAQQIDVAAATWAARIDRGLSNEEQVQLDRWLEGDVRRPGALARQSWTMMRTERAAALGSDFVAADFRPAERATLSRRRWLATGAAAVAASVFGVVAWDKLGGTRYATRKGEMRVVSLEDGSAISLNTATTLEVTYSRQRRSIRLIDGEALFDVAKDPRRPFTVQAGDNVVRAIGTSFTVSRVEGRPVTVLVREGVVELSHPSRRQVAATRLVASDRAVEPIDGSPAVITALKEVDVRRELAWRDGRLVFDGDTLEAAAAAFARYSDTRIVIDDAALAREEIAGIYQASDPIGFAQSVSLSLNGRAHLQDGEVHILR